GCAVGRAGAVGCRHGQRCEGIGAEHVHGRQAPQNPARPGGGAAWPVCPVERQRLLHGQHQHGGSPGPVLPVQLQLEPLRGDARQVQAALHPGHVSVRVLAQPGALDRPGGYQLAPGEDPQRAAVQGGLRAVVGGLQGGRHLQRELAQGLELDLRDQPVPPGLHVPAIQVRLPPAGGPVREDLVQLVQIHPGAPGRRALHPDVVRPCQREPQRGRGQVLRPEQGDAAPAPWAVLLVLLPTALLSLL
ncbi:folate receptor alpha-like, partial [Chelydra serpentina]